MKSILKTMSDPTQIIQPIIMPSLLAAPYTHLSEAIRVLEEAGVTLFHYDVMDGHFVPNMSGSPMIIEDLQPVLKSELDVHLMVDNPERVIPWFDYACVRSISIHVEASLDMNRDLSVIRSLGKRAGVVINPNTPNEHLNPYLEQADQVLVMTVYPGLGGQPMIRETLGKIEYFAKRREQTGCKYVIQVDGGVNEETIAWVHQAGANEIVSGSAVFRKKDPAETFRHMNRLIGISV